VKISFEQARALRKWDFSAGMFVEMYWFIYSYLIFGLLIDGIIMFGTDISSDITHYYGKVVLYETFKL